MIDPIWMMKGLFCGVGGGGNPKEKKYVYTYVCLYMYVCMYANISL